MEHRTARRWVRSSFEPKHFETPMQNWEIIECVKGGQTDRVQRSFLPMAITIATKYAATYSYGEDLIGVAVLAMVEAVNRIDIHHPNVSGYVNKYIDGIVLNFVNSEGVVKRCRVKKKALDRTRLLSDNDLPNEYHRLQVKYFGIPIEEQLLESRMFTATEKEVMRMRIEGYNDREIAEKLGFTNVWIGKLRANLKDRVMYILKGEACA